MKEMLGKKFVLTRDMLRKQFSLVLNASEELSDIAGTVMSGNSFTLLDVIEAGTIDEGDILIDGQEVEFFYNHEEFLHTWLCVIGKEFEITGVHYAPTEDEYDFDIAFDGKTFPYMITDKSLV